MQSRIIVLTLLILSIDKIICMRCYEGFNASVADIPFYHWAERQCEGNSECMIQDVVFKDGNFGVSVRYGGCISSSYSSLATCEQLFGEESTVTLPQYYTLIAGGDEKIRSLVMDFIKDPETHRQLIYSRGKGREEFYSGVLTFLGNLGFDKEKINAPLRRYLIKYLANVHASTNYDVLEDLFNSVSLFESMTVMNEATERLTNAFLECLVPMYTHQPTNIEMLIITSLPEFFYPIVSLGPNATDVYNTISEGFESICKKPVDLNSVLPEENIKTFLFALNFFQLFSNEVTTTNKKMIYAVSIHTIEVYMKAYPDSSIPKTAYRLAKVIKQYEEMLSALHPCSETAVECASKIKLQRYKVILDIVKKVINSQESSNFFTAWYDMRYLYLWSDQLTDEDYIEITAAWSHWAEKGKGNLASWIFYISRPVNNIAKKMDKDSRKKFRKGIVPHSCKHYFCASDLCNRHGILEALQPSLGTFSGKVEHEEL